MIRVLIIALFIMGAGFVPAPASAGDDGFNVLQEFYAARDYKPVWTVGNKFNRAARELPKVLQGAQAHGLEAASYGALRMNVVLTDEQPEGPNAWRQAELFWTYGLWHYASDLAGHTLDAPTLENLIDGDVADNLNALAPADPLYKALQQKLAMLDAQESVPGLNFGRRLFKPGMSSAAVPELRARMVAFGAYETAPENTSDANLYGATLARAVGRFQHEYGLKDDGAIGPVTLSLLNRDPAVERRQVIANLQRLREPHRRLREDTRIDVSIARYWLTAYKGGVEELSMPVVVGKPARQTISFRTEISGVRLNPTWTVPNTIKREDFIPMLISNPSGITNKHGLKVVKEGKTVDPSQVDWSQMTPRELMQVGFWRPAGEGNPLGRYRVIMENPYDIYLHDTNHKELFEISSRAQSSGCVRVARPQELTDFILSTKAGWNPQKTADILKVGRTADVVIENKIPIYLDYMTAWFNDRGQLIVGVDIYDLDKPRYDILVKNGLMTQKDAQTILTRAADLLSPELKEAQNRESVLTHSTN